MLSSGRILFIGASLLMLSACGKKHHGGGAAAPQPVAPVAPTAQNADGSSGDAAKSASGTGVDAGTAAAPETTTAQEPAAAPAVPTIAEALTALQSTYCTVTLAHDTYRLGTSKLAAGSSYLVAQRGFSPIVYAANTDDTNVEIAVLNAGNIASTNCASPEVQLMPKMIFLVEASIYGSMDFTQTARCTIKAGQEITDVNMRTDDGVTSLGFSDMPTWCGGLVHGFTQQPVLTLYTK